jgi:adenylate cyclase
VVAGLAVGGLAVAVHLTLRAELQTLDWRWQLRADRHEDPRLAIVSIDDESLHRRDATWPLSRSVHAQVVRRVAAMGADQIVYNQQFDLQGPSAVADDRLLNAFRDAPNVVLPATQTEDGGPRFLGGGRENREISEADFGGDTQRLDDDGAIRRFPLRDDALGLRSFAAVAAATAVGGELNAPSDDPWIALPATPCALNGRASGDGRLRCDIPSFALDALLDGRVPSDALDGKVVVVGPVGSDQQVLRHTWAGGDRLATTTELTAREIGTALRGFPLRSAPAWACVLLTILLCGVPALVAARVEGSLTTSVREPSWPASAALVGLSGLAAATAVVLSAVLAFRAGQVTPLVAPATCVMATTLLAVVRVGTLLRRRAADVWRTAAALAPQQLVERVVLRAGSPAAIAGEPMVMTIMFADLRSSTRYVLELGRPEETWAFSQAFIRRAVEAVEAQHGYALSLEGGDGILAVFGPQFGGPRHARLAITAALDLTGPVLDDIRAEIDACLPQLRDLLLEKPLGMRVAVHTGEVVYGGSGSDGAAPRRWSTSTVGRATWEAAKLRAAAAPENAENWDPAARELIFGRPDADERIVVVSEEAMAAARNAAPREAGPEYGFVHTSVVATGDVPIDVWVHQGGHDAVPSAGTDVSVQRDRTDGEADAAAPTPGEVTPSS